MFSATIRRWLSTGLFLTVIQACLLSNATGNDQFPILARLPVKLSGIFDARVDFARVFDAELMSDEFWSRKGNAEDFLFYNRNESSNDRRASTAYKKTAVLVIPGMFGECFDHQALPFTDGKVRNRKTTYTESYKELLAPLGVHSIEAVRVLGRGSSAENAGIIRKAILDKASDPQIAAIVVVAYSKGAPDALESIFSMSQAGELPSKLQALVSVGGVVMGTPIADSLGNLYRVLNKIIGTSRCSASNGEDIASLRPDVRSKWMEQSPMPDSVQLYSVVATTTKDKVGLGLRGSYTLLSVMDSRNDGQMIMSDAILPKSTLLAVAKSDHWDFVLPLSLNPDRKIRGLTSGKDFPRQALFRAVIRYVIDDLPKR